MTTLVEKITSMGSAEKYSTLLYCNSYTSDWMCVAEGSHNGVEYKITKTGDNPDEAVNSAYEAWRNLTDRVPELRPALEYVAVPSTSKENDDDIPF